MDKKCFKDYVEAEVYRESKSFILKLYNKYCNPVTNAVYLYRKMQYLRSVGGC